MTADQVIAHLQLEPHPVEGGYFRETYRSSGSLSAYGGDRSIGTAIYYLLTPKTVSALHRLPGDEVFHFYLGDPVRMLQLSESDSRTFVLGTDLRTGHVPQLVVPAGTWQGSILIEGGAWALLGATMAPGFDYLDYEPGDRETLTAQYPGDADFIRRLLP